MKKSEQVILYVFCLCFFAWAIVNMITPVGGWNVKSSNYNPLYFQLFCITGLSAIISLIGLTINNRN